MNNSSDSLGTSIGISGSTVSLAPHPGIAVSGLDGGKGKKRNSYEYPDPRRHRMLTRNELFALIGLAALILLHIATMVAIYVLVPKWETDASYAISVVIPGLTPNIFLALLFFLIYKDADLNGKGFITIVVLSGSAVAISLAFTYVEQFFPVLSPVYSLEPSQAYLMVENGQLEYDQPVYFNESVYGCEFLSTYDNITEYYALLDAYNKNETAPRVYILATIDDGADLYTLNPTFQGFVEGTSDDWSFTQRCNCCDPNATYSYANMFLADVSSYLAYSKVNNRGLYVSGMIVPVFMYALGVIVPIFRYKLM